MEACGSSHYWAREMIRLGHQLKLIAPAYIKAFIKRQKNDAADADAIVGAALRPTMRLWRRRPSDSSPAPSSFPPQNSWLISALNWSKRILV